MKRNSMPPNCDGGYFVRSTTVRGNLFAHTADHHMTNSASTRRRNMSGLGLGPAASCFQQHDRANAANRLHERIDEPKVVKRFQGQ